MSIFECRCRCYCQCRDADAEIFERPFNNLSGTTMVAEDDHLQIFQNYEKLKKKKKKKEQFKSDFALNLISSTNIFQFRFYF